MKRLKSTMGLLAVTLLLLAGCVSIPTGDGGKIKLSKDGVEVEDKDGEKTNISVDTDEGGYSMDFEDGTSTSAGSHATIPEGFPKDILLPKDGQLLLSTESENEGRPAYMLSYQIEGDMKKDAEIYHAYLTDNDYEIQELVLGDTVLSYQGRKTTHYVHYQWMGDEGDPDYTMSIMYGELEDE